MSVGFIPIVPHKLTFTQINDGMEQLSKMLQTPIDSLPLPREKGTSINHNYFDYSVFDKYENYFTFWDEKELPYKSITKVLKK